MSRLAFCKGQEIKLNPITAARNNRSHNPRSSPPGNGVGSRSIHYRRGGRPDL